MLPHKRFRTFQFASVSIVSISLGNEDVRLRTSCTTKKRRSRNILLFGIIWGVLFLIVQQSYLAISAWNAESSSKTMCINRYGGIMQGEGMGALLQRCKDTLILAHALDAEVYIGNLSDSIHGYNVADLGFFRKDPCPDDKRHQDMADAMSKNVRNPSTNQLSSQKRCQIPNRQLMALLTRICRQQLDKAEIMEILGLDGCSTIQHIVEMGEILEHYNDCLAPWYHDAIRRSRAWSDAYDKPDDCVRIGIHLRWGDVAQQQGKIQRNTSLDIRSISIQDVNKAYSHIHFIGCPCQKIKVYIENNPGFVPDTFVFEDFDVVDSGDDLRDLIDLAQNDILIQGASSFAVLAAFSTSNKKVISNALAPHGVFGAPHGNRKYNQWFRIVNQLYSPEEEVVHTCNTSS